mgnify:CR=1 FL=1
MNINIGEILLKLWNDSGFAAISSGFISDNGWQYAVMLVISFVLLYLAIVKKFEPLLLLPIAFGMLLVNLPGVREEIFRTVKTITPVFDKTVPSTISAPFLIVRSVTVLSGILILESTVC